MRIGIDIGSQVGPPFSESTHEGWKVMGVWAFLIFLAILFFWKILFLPGDFHIPYDIHDYHYPLVYEIFRGIRQGSFPLWDQHTYAGMPLAGNIQAQLFYPPTLLVVLLSSWLFEDLPYRMVEYLLVLHYPIAGFCAYLLARSCTLSRLPALLAAIVYSFGGFFASQMQHLGLISGAAWVPLIFFFLKRSLDTHRFLYAAGAAVALALVILAGFPALLIATLIFTIMVCVLLAGAKLLRGDRRQCGFVALVLVMMVGGAIALAAIQLLPTWELTRHSLAQNLHEMVGLTGLPAESYLSLLLPTIFGGGTGKYWGGVEATMIHLYVGVAPLLLVLVCLLFPKRALTFLVLGVALFALLWSAGETTPLSGWIWVVVPETVRAAIYTYCATVFFDLGLALMAGFGLEFLSRDTLGSLEGERIRTLSRWITLISIFLLGVSILIHAFASTTEFGTDPRGRLITITQGINVLIFLLLFVAAAFYWRIAGFFNGSALGWIVILVTIIELFTYGSGRSFNTIGGNTDKPLSARTLDGSTAQLSVFQSDPDFHAGNHMRIDTLCRGARIWRTASRLWGIESADGDDPFLLKDYAAFRASMSSLDSYRSFLLAKPDSPLVDLLGVKYVLVCPGSEFSLPSDFVLVSDNYYRIYRNQGALPRAFLVRRSVVKESVTSALQFMGSESFDPRETVVLTNVRDSPQPDSQASAAVSNGDSLGTAQILSYLPNRIEIRAEPDVRSFLVLTDIYYPGWRAYIDGSRVELLRANGIFRAVRIDPGPHRIVFEYRPWTVIAGGIISGLALLSFVSIWIFNARRRSRANFEEATALH